MNVPPGAALPAVDFDVAIEVASHKALIRQTYKDSVGVLTWCVGMTNATGHKVDRYIGKLAALQHCVNPVRLGAAELCRGRSPRLQRLFDQQRPVRRGAVVSLEHWLDREGVVGHAVEAGQDSRKPRWLS